jgi:hypothetical protein
MIICFVVAFSICLVYLIVSDINIKKMLVSFAPSTISTETKKSDMGLVYDAIYRSFIKCFYNYINSDHTFDEKNSIKKYVNKFEYRDLVNCLLQPNVCVEKNVTFFESFATNVYLVYVSETSKQVKNLFYKYYSGKTMFDYDSKKSNPSILNFITEYTKSQIWEMYSENIKSEKKLFDDKNISTSAGAYIEACGEYDKTKCNQIRLDFYNIIRASTISYSDNNTKTEVK